MELDLGGQVLNILYKKQEHVSSKMVRYLRTWIEIQVSQFTHARLLILVPLVTFLPPTAAAQEDSQARVLPRSVVMLTECRP